MAITISKTVTYVHKIKNRWCDFNGPWYEGLSKKTTHTYDTYITRDWRGVEFKKTSVSSKAVSPLCPQLYRFYIYLQVVLWIPRKISYINYFWGVIILAVIYQLVGLSWYHRNIINILETIELARKRRFMRYSIN